MPTTYSRLTEQLAPVIKRAIEQTTKLHPHMSGFALCTDSSLRTLFSVTTDTARGEPKWATPNEWNQRPALADKIKSYSKTLAILADAHTDNEVHCANAWNALETAVRQAQPPSDLLLLIAPTDPDKQTRTLMERSVRTLNSRDTSTLWSATINKIDESELARIRARGIKIRL